MRMKIQKKNRPFTGMPILLALLLMSTSVASAHDGEEHQHADAGKEHADSHSNKSSIDVSKLTVVEIMQNISKGEEELSKAISEKRLSDVHGIAFSIRDLSKELPSKVSEDKRSRVEGTAGNIARLAAELDNSGDAGDQTRTESNAKKLNGVLKLLKAQVE